LQVEATKYTELGYIGRDVEDIIKDLVENAYVRGQLRKFKCSNFGNAMLPQA